MHAFTHSGRLCSSLVWARKREKVVALQKVLICPEEN
jgi:hypothetical protein